MLCHLLTKLELTASASMAQRLTDDCVFQWADTPRTSATGTMTVKYGAHPGVSCPHTDYFTLDWF